MVYFSIGLLGREVDGCFRMFGKSLIRKHFMKTSHGKFWYAAKGCRLRLIDGFKIVISKKRSSLSKKKSYSAIYDLSVTKYLRQTLAFMWNSALREKFSFCFFRRFLLTLTKFRKGDWALGNNSIKFWDFPDIS